MDDKPKPSQLFAKIFIERYADMHAEKLDLPKDPDFQDKAKAVIEYIMTQPAEIDLDEVCDLSPLQD